MHDASCGDDGSRRRCWVWMSSAAARARCLWPLAAAGPAPAAARAAAAIVTAAVLVMRFMRLLAGISMTPGTVEPPAYRRATALLRPALRTVRWGRGPDSARSPDGPS